MELDKVDLEAIEEAVARAATKYPLVDRAVLFSDVYELLVEIIEREMLKPGGGKISNLGGLAYKVARRRGRDLQLSESRRISREELVALDAQIDHDDQVARMISERGSAEQVTAALAYGSGLGDRIGVRVVTVWLNLAEDSGEAPRRIDIAEQAGVSLPTVDAALRRFRSYVEAVG